MADPILTGGIRVLSVLQGISGLPEDRYVNTWAFSSDVADSDVAKIAAAGKVGNFFQLAAGVNPAVKASLAASSIDESACEFRVYWMGEPPPRTPMIIPWNIGALGTAQALPSEVAVCCSFYAESNRPRNRGRVFIGPLTIGVLGGTASEAPTVIGAFQGALRDAAQDLLEDVTGPRWCVLGTSSDGTSRELKIVTAGWVDNAFDTQRRRGEEATSRTLFPV